MKVVARGGVEPPTFRFSVGSFAQVRARETALVRSACNIAKVIPMRHFLRWTHPSFDGDNQWVPLPSGTVSLLFSDIEGSTALLTAWGMRTPTPSTGNDGFCGRPGPTTRAEMGTEGDSFFVVFATAPARDRRGAAGPARARRVEWPRGRAGARADGDPHRLAPRARGRIRRDGRAPSRARSRRPLTAGRCLMSAVTAELADELCPPGWHAGSRRSIG